MLLAFNYFYHKTASPDFLQATSQVVHTCSRVLGLALTDGSVREDGKSSVTSACSASLWLHIRRVCSLSGQTWSQKTRPLEYLTGHLTTLSKRLNFIYVYLVVERSGGLFNIFLYTGTTAPSYLVHLGTKRCPTSMRRKLQLYQTS